MMLLFKKNRKKLLKRWCNKNVTGDEILTKKEKIILLQIGAKLGRDIDGDILNFFIDESKGVVKPIIGSCALGMGK